MNFELAIKMAYEIFMNIFKHKIWNTHRKIGFNKKMDHVAFYNFVLYE